MLTNIINTRGVKLVFLNVTVFTAHYGLFQLRSGHGEPRNWVNMTLNVVKNVSVSSKLTEEETNSQYTSMRR